eukprot:gene16211-17842_t
MDSADRVLDLSVLLQNLSNANDEDQVFKALLDLNMIVDAKASVREQLLKLDLSIFLKQVRALTSERAKQIAASLLGKVFSCLNSYETLSKYAEHFVEGLNSGTEEIRIVYLAQLESVISDSKGAQFLEENFQAGHQNSILVHVAENLAHQSTGVAKLAANVIRNLCISNSSLLSSEEFVSVLNRLLGKGSVVRFRVYDLFIRIFLSINEVLTKPGVTEIFNKLMNEINKSDDILTQLNCLEMLSEMASASSVGLKFISDSGTLDRLHNIFKLAEVDPLQGMLIPGAVKFFGSLAINKPSEILENYQEFVWFVFTNVESDDLSLMALCFETIANICTTAEGLKLICKDQKRMNNVMRLVGKHIQSTVDESIKTRILGAIAVIFHSTVSLATLMPTKEKLYRSIAQNPLQLFVDAAKIPFPTIRCASLNVLVHLACYSWVEEDMALTPGFLEYLLDRKTEPDKQGKELKYDIVKNLSKSKTAKETLGLEYYQRICQYAKEGPFKSDQETAVDFEQAD